MNESLQQLLLRNSAPRLAEPGPDEDACQYMFQAALRAPDHAWLKPWRFQLIRGEARERLGEVFLQSLLARDPGAGIEARDKAQKAPLRAPMIVVVICRYTQHPKVPAQEQLLSAGCAAHALLLAAEAQGYAGIWRTGSYVEDPTVASALGLERNEQIVGFLYFGSREGTAKLLPERKVEDYVSYWPA
jgi:nitroreductase